jgi:hypothetical protein
LNLSIDLDVEFGGSTGGDRKPPQIVDESHYLRIAVAFMVASKVYTTMGFRVHERICARNGWGIKDS